MKIECYMSAGCATEVPLRENIGKALELEGIKAEVIFRRIRDEEAFRLGFRGSPTVLINGVDIEPGEMPGFS